MSVTPAKVLETIKSPTPTYLCPLSANKYGVDFLKFVVADNDSKTVVYEVSIPPDFSAQQQLGASIDGPWQAGGDAPLPLDGQMDCCNRALLALGSGCLFSGLACLHTPPGGTPAQVPESCEHAIHLI